MRLGFCGCPEGKNAGQHRRVHPGYGAAEEGCWRCAASDEDVRRGMMSQLMQKVQAMGEAAVLRKTGVGVPTLQDVVRLMKPGRDLRSDLPAAHPCGRTCWRSKDLKPGMVLTPARCTASSTSAYSWTSAAQDGLVHRRCAISSRKHPSEVVAVGR